MPAEFSGIFRNFSEFLGGPWGSLRNSAPTPCGLLGGPRMSSWREGAPYCALDSIMPRWGPWMSLDYHPFQPLLNYGWVTCRAWACRLGQLHLPVGYEGVTTSGTRIRGLSGPELPSRFTPLKGSAVSSQQSAVSINADAVLTSLSSWPLLCGPLRAQ